MKHTVTVEFRPDEFREGTEDDVWRGTVFKEGDKILVAGGGWHAFCSCGWSANNPHDDEDHARQAREFHELTAAVEDARAEAVQDFLSASGADERLAAEERFMAAGRGMIEGIREIGS
jgi:CDGSH-type Zn-finger protein